MAEGNRPEIFLLAVPVELTSAFYYLGIIDKTTLIVIQESLRCLQKQSNKRVAVHLDFGLDSCFSFSAQTCTHYVACYIYIYIYIYIKS